MKIPHTIQPSKYGKSIASVNGTLHFYGDFTPEEIEAYKQEFEASDKRDFYPFNIKEKKMNNMEEDDDFQHDDEWLDYCYYKWLEEQAKK